MIIFLPSMFQVLVLCIVNFIYISKKGHLKEMVLLTIPLSLISGIIFYYLGMISVFIPIMVLSIYNYRHSKSTFLSLIVPFISLIILIVSDHISFILEMYLLQINIETITTNYAYMAFHIALFTTLTISFSLLLKVIFLRLRHQLALLEKYRTIIITLIILTIVFIYINFVSVNKLGFTREIIELNSVIIFVYMVFVILALGLLMSSVVINLKAKNKQAELEQLREYSEGLEDMYVEIDKFRHDYVNILSTLSEFIRKRDMDGLEAYFNKRIIPTGEEIKINTYKLSSLKNMKVKEVKGILFSKIIKGQEHGIDMSVEITEEIEEINFDSIALCRCLGIILDNAIEESMQHEDGKVIVGFIKKTESLLIIVANTIGSKVPELYQMFKKGYSTKGKGRGTGLSNLRDLITAHEHITLDTKVERELFFQEIRISEE